MKRRNLILILIVLSSLIFTAVMYREEKRVDYLCLAHFMHESPVITLLFISIIVTLVGVSVLVYELSPPPIILVISALGVLGILFLFAVSFRLEFHPIEPAHLVFDPFSNASLFLNLAFVVFLLAGLGLPMLIYIASLLFTRRKQDY